MMMSRNGKRKRQGQSQNSAGHNHIFPPEKGDGGEGIEELPSGDGIFTPTQQRMYDVLVDGWPHTQDELWECLNDELAPRRNVGYHVTNLRARLKPMGFGIHCDESVSPPTYALVRFLRRSSE